MFETVSLVGYHQGRKVSLYLSSVPDIVHQICRVAAFRPWTRVRVRVQYMVIDVRQHLGNLPFIVGPEGSPCGSLPKGDALILLSSETCQNAQQQMHRQDLERSAVASAGKRAKSPPKMRWASLRTLGKTRLMTRTRKGFRAMVRAILSGCACSC